MGRLDQLARQAPLSFFLALAFCALPWGYWHGLHLAGEIPKSMLISAVACAGALLWLGLTWRQGRALNWHPLWLAVAALFAWALVSLNWSADPKHSVLALTQLSAYLLLAFLGAQAMAERRADVVAIGVVVGAASLAAVIIGQAYGLNPFHYAQHAAPAGTFGNKNFAALYFDLVIPLGLVLVLGAEQPRARWLAGLALALSLSVLALVHTRGAWLGFAAAALVFVVAVLGSRSLRDLATQRLRANWQPLAAAIVVAGALALLAPSPMGQPTAPASVGEPTVHNDLSVQSRLAAYQNVLPLIAAHPLTGVGYGGFALGFRPYVAARAPIPTVTEFKSFTELHSDPLQFFAELGVPGGLLMLGLVLAVLVMLWRRAGGSRSQPTPALASVGLLLALAASSAHAWVDFPLQRPASAALFWLCLGMALGLAGRATRLYGSGLSRGMVAGLSLCFLAFTGYQAGFYWKYWSGSTAFMASQRAIAAGDCPTALDKIGDSLWQFGADYSTRQRFVHLYRVCRLDSAIQIYAMSQALGYDPLNPLARMTRGELWLKRDKLDAARADFEVLVRTLPHRASGHLGLGLIAQRQGDVDGARAHFQTAKAVQPDSTVADKLLTQLEKTPIIGDSR